MYLVLRNVKKKDLQLIKAPAKRFDFEIEIVETDNKPVDID